jgi:hypothetical protein
VFRQRPISGSRSLILLVVEWVGSLSRLEAGAPLATVSGAARGVGLLDALVRGHPFLRSLRGVRACAAVRVGLLERPCRGNGTRHHRDRGTDGLRGGAPPHRIGRGPPLVSESPRRLAA